MSGFMTDLQVVDRVLTHVRERSTDRGTELWREPVANYLSEDRLQKELALFRRLPIPFCPSAALTDIGSYIARPAAGVPLLVVRGKDGKVRAFKNACRHRGAQLAEGAGCSQAFVCPYHGWAYRLDGVLQNIPHEDGFPDIEKDDHGLIELTAEERHGLVYVTQETGGPDSTLPEGLPDLIGSDQQVISSRENLVDANWKVFMESFLEGYHIKYAHPETFYPYGYDNLNVIEMSGRHARVTYPFRRIEKLAGRPDAERVAEGRLTYVYHLFPNVLLTVLSRHTNLVILEPVNLNQTRQYSFGLTHGIHDKEALEQAKRDAEFVADTGVQEDLALVTGIQRSIRSDANDCFIFGEFESAIVHFHKNLTALLE